MGARRRACLDPEVNLTYAVPYLANAYRLADGNEARATALYRSGYYYLAKREKMQGLLRTASSPALTLEPAPAPQPPQNPFTGLLSFLSRPAEFRRRSGAAKRANAKPRIIFLRSLLH